MTLKLIIGLGNIGKKYEKTRHNVGFMLVEHLLNNAQVIEKYEKFKSIIYKVIIKEISSEPLYLLLPQTFMNASGDAVSAFASFYKISQGETLVIYDDLDLKLGKVKLKLGGSDAGHNGIKDIDSKFGKNYFRLRIGISKPENKQDVINYVLCKFGKQEMEVLNALFEKIANDELKKIADFIAKNLNYSFAVS
jgi:PTH1 family peptidyl-tRNA hydrolase